MKKIAICSATGIAAATQLADDLLNAGAISILERDTLIELTRSDQLADSKRQANRVDDARPASQISQPRQENQMNPNAIIKSIEDNRKVMEAQLETLGQIPLEANKLSVSESSTPDSVSSLFHEAIRAHLRGAATTLNALSEVENRVRSLQNTVPAKPPQPDIIDVDVVVVSNNQPKE
jgi:hypothetical protein